VFLKKLRRDPEL